MAGEVIAALAESSGSLPLGFMASVTCGLTAEDRDQLRNHTLVSSTGLPLPLTMLSNMVPGDSMIWHGSRAAK